MSRIPTAGQARSSVRRELSRLSVFEFLGREFMRVRRFGRRTRLLRVRFVPPGIRMNPEIGRLLAARVAPAGRALSERLAPVMAQGWLRLTPRQYNTLALVQELAGRVAAFDFARLNVRHRAAADEIRDIEAAFLRLHRDPDCLRTIAAALVCVERRDLTGMVLQILAEDCMVPSLYDCILALNMFKYRRGLQMEDLLPPASAPVVDPGRYRFNGEARRRVDELVSTMRESLRILRGRLEDARRISGSAPLNGAGIEALSAVYDAKFPGPLSSFQADLQDLAVFTVRLLASFTSLFGPLLNGRITLAGEAPVSLFSPPAFSGELGKLRAYSERLETGFRRSVRVPLSRYLRIKDGRLQAIGEEAEISQLVGNVAGCLVDLGRKVLDILHPDSRRPGETSGLPAGRLQGMPAALNGLSVKEALRKAVQMCFAAGVLLEDSILVMILSREKRLKMEIRSRAAFLKRVLDPLTYQEMVDRDLHLQVP